MKCGIKFKDISLYVDGKYSKKRREALKAHIADCPRCSKYMNTLKALRASLSHLRPIEEPAGFDFEFNRLLEQAIEKRAERSLKARLARVFSGINNRIIAPVPVTVRAAASFLLIISLALGIRSQALQKAPFIEFASGDIRIYKRMDTDWVRPKPDMRLNAGDKIKLEDGAILNLASKGKFRARLKDESLMVLSRLKNGPRNIDTGFSLSYGNLLVNTTGKFKGSKMSVYTPACDAEVVGTAFMVKVFDNDTWLGVLEGRVKITPKMHPLKSDDFKAVPAYISAGQKAVTESYNYSTTPSLFSDREWKTMLELYQLVEAPNLMLLLGTGPERVNELLSRPTLVYIPSSVRPLIPAKVLEAIESVTQAVDKGDTGLIKEKTAYLQGLLTQYPDPRYNDKIFMFIGSNFYFAGDYESSIRAFEKVTTDFPDSEFASLAQCGIASIYQNDLKDVNKAEQAYNQLIKAYPSSADAMKARDMLSAQQ